jgi:hypothetical protein
VAASWLTNSNIRNNSSSGATLYNCARIPDGGGGGGEAAPLDNTVRDEEAMTALRIQERQVLMTRYCHVMDVLGLFFYCSICVHDIVALFV